MLLFQNKNVFGVFMGSERKFSTQSLKNYRRHFYVLALFLFNSSKMEPDYYHYKFSVGNFSRVAKDLRKRGNIRRISKLIACIA